MNFRGYLVRSHALLDYETDPAMNQAWCAQNFAPQLKTNTKIQARGHGE